MEESQRSSVPEEEVRGLNINLDNAMTESNGHREGKAENIVLVETMRSLNMEVLSYRVDNERLVRAQKEQNHINTQLLEKFEQVAEANTQEIRLRIGSSKYITCQEGRC